MQPPSTQTPAQQRLARIAADLAAANPDAAAELARHMAHHAAQAKRWRGFGIMLCWNEVTGRIELTQGESGTGPIITK